ncbi:hypothetical protein [Gymnodinialimonas sp. 57CJ19]|uniref:hypothetical protein n=1 Tax=Gymnodinialimonas sp. 57CJ19 TaxID=3138498 RepID=UPI0031343A7B
MKHAKLWIAAFVALSLPACVVLDTVPPEAVGPGPFLTGGGSGASARATSPGPGPGAASLQQFLSGQQITRHQESHRLLPGSRVAGRFYSGPGDYYDVNGTWSARGNVFCIGVEVSEPFCGNAVINGNQLLHYINGPTSPDVWVIE